jgi:hypothetical protein
VGLTTLPCKKKIVEKPPRNSAGFCGGQGLSWAVEPSKEEEFKYSRKQKGPCQKIRKMAMIGTIFMYFKYRQLKK